MKTGFPENYIDSRTHFRKAAESLGAQLSQYPVDVPGVPELSIDVARLGPPDKPAVVVTSGLHGVEGYCGAAIQLAWLAAQSNHPTAGRFILVHALNPYGYALGRRVNEDNIDLNRNFLDAESRQSVLDRKVSADYARFNDLLNPAKPPRQIDGFLLNALAHLAREGKSKLQNAIVPGQYDYARGLFYGGSLCGRSVDVVRENIHHWVADAPEICHLDFHTGLGQFAQCQLLVQSAPGLAEYSWFEQAFGAESLVATEADDSSAYQAHGAMGNWLTQHVNDRPYRFLTAEFGTYSALKVLSALRTENQAFHFASPGSNARARAREQLERCFCPPSSRWRSKVVRRGVGLIEQAGTAVRPGV